MVVTYVKIEEVLMEKKRKKYFVSLCTIGFCILFLGISQTFAAMITVTNTNDSGVGSLRQALIDAGSGDTIVFNETAFPDAETGTITLSTGELTIDKALAIEGDGRVTIDGNNTFRVFYISYSTTTFFVDVALQGLKIVNGKADYGAGVKCLEHLTVTNCHLSGNTATIHGGGLQILYGNGLISSSLFTDNHAGTPDYGGYGSGMALYNQANCTVDQCTFSGNTANAGAAIHVNGSSLTLTNSLLHRNQSVYDGGGIYNYNSTTRVYNSTLSGNSTQLESAASALENAYSTVYVVNSTVTAGTGGVGAVSNYDSTCTITSSIIAGNEGTDIHWRHGNSPLVVSQSLLEGVDYYTIPDGADGNIIGHAPALANLVDNGGSTLTHALIPGSPAIDGGSNSLSLNHDQRGAGFPRKVGVEVDMGAFELQEIWYDLTVNTDGDGFGTILSSPPNINFTHPASNTGTAFFQAGSVALKAMAEEGSVVFWNDCTGQITGNGTDEATCTLISLSADVILTATFRIPGDVNRDGDLTLGDAIITLQLAAGKDVPAYRSGDADGDSIITLAEALYLLQTLGGLR
jgi:hypothetical protein